MRSATTLLGVCAILLAGSVAWGDTEAIASKSGKPVLADRPERQNRVRRPQNTPMSQKRRKDFKHDPPEDGPVLLENVPAYDWYHGCGPTAAASIIGYYDMQGYSNLFDALR